MDLDIGTARQAALGERVQVRREFDGVDAFEMRMQKCRRITSERPSLTESRDAKAPLTSPEKSTLVERLWRDRTAPYGVPVSTKGPMEVAEALPGASNSTGD